MKPNSHDIGDNEIRIIVNNKPEPKPRRRLTTWIAITIALITILLITLLSSTGNSSDNELTIEPQTKQKSPLPEYNHVSPTDSITDSTLDSPAKPISFTEITDTVIGRHKLVIMTPINSTPKIQLGAGTLEDSTAILVAEAAGVRNDNGQIVGACVIGGQLLSKGQSKSGFCAIINGTMTIGVADTTPLLEQALETDGYFFRQYPLVVGGQVVENRPKGKSLRKALAEYNGRHVIIMSKEPLTFHDFSTSLVDLGVSNAIYLIGSSASGFARTIDGELVTFGKPNPNPPFNSTYITWN